MKTKLLFSVFLLFVMIQNAQSQWTYSNLSEPKFNMGATTLGNKAYFAGGSDLIKYMDKVEVYDVSTGTWEVAGKLSKARQIIGGLVSCNSKIYFAGGGFDENVSYDIVDIYDTLTKEWSVAHLSVDRFSLNAISHGDTVMFAGGVQVKGGGTEGIFKNTVDIYNTKTGVWTVNHLSIARMGMAATVVGDLAFFAGGMGFIDNPNALTTTARVDIYNFKTKTWSIASLSQARAFSMAVTVGSKVIIAGGCTEINKSTNRVDIYDTSTDKWTTTALSVARAGLGNAAVVAGKAYFVGGGNFKGGGLNMPSDVIDIYDPVNNTWSMDFLTQPVESHSVVGVGNHLIVAGGQTVGEVCLKKVEIYTDTTLIRVPADYPKIQAAIDAANNGDIILVAENTYYENINFKGKSIVVASEFIMDGDTSHISKTVINGSQPENTDIGSVVTFESGEDTTSVLCGFTITGGNGSIETIESSVWRIGGGIRILASGAKLLNNYIEGNTVSNTGGVMGGGIVSGREVTNMPWIVLRNNKVRNNKALSSGHAANVGGIQICYNLIMADNEISHNETNGSLYAFGGGALIYGAFGPIKVNIRNNLITENKAVSVSNISTNTEGGGLEIINCSGIVSDNIISNNIIESSPGKLGIGAGVYVNDIIAKDFIFENNIISNNSYVGETCLGGGIIMYNTEGKFRNNVIVDNKATRGGGFTIANNPGGPSVLINNTITGNTATTYGAGLYINSAKAEVINNIIWGNTAPTGASIHQIESTLTVKYSDVEGGTLWPGEGNINEDPMFTDSIKNPFALSEGSPCIENGIPDTTGLNLPPWDIIGNHRIWGARVDMGAYEFGSPVVGNKELTAAGKTISFMNYPNPFTTSTTFTFRLEKSANVNIRVFDIFGRLVAEPVNEFHQIGEQNVQWNTEGLPSGLYFCRLKAGNQYITHKIVKM